MEAFVNEAAFEAFLAESGKIRYNEPSVAASASDIEPYRQAHERRENAVLAFRRKPFKRTEDAGGMTEEDKLKKRDQVIQRVNSMSMVDLLTDLMQEKKLTLSRNEKADFAALKRRRMLEHGANTPKRKPLPLPELKKLRQAERAYNKQCQEETRETGLYGISKTGRKYTPTIGTIENLLDLTWEKVHPEAAKRHRKLSDHRGRPSMWDGSRSIDGLPGRYADGELRIKHSTIRRLGGRIETAKDRKAQKPIRRES
ncbi:hypothetical protein QR46_0970 [Giardia duodenalis assemblage B]|uniref:Uncharacterized protein n=2 Tax=Giardia intestinalis TaxID=5741 RepID=A0A132NZ67_GIAIN|nr:Hypothetical protein GSB_9782 [Giardia intestinalis]KWX14992.1 hypothetical protein QR46_0970 [Giardia intestinalis assemblage B]